MPDCILANGHTLVVTCEGNNRIGMVRSSDRILGRVDVLAQIFETQKPLSSLVLVNEQKANSLNTLSSPIRMNHVLMATTFRFDRLGSGLFEWNEADGASLALDFDHQLVMSGKLAHLVPKTEKGRRNLELGDLVFLLLFAILPQKKHIKSLFRGIRQCRVF